MKVRLGSRHKSSPVSETNPVLARRVFGKVDRFGAGYSHVADAFAQRTLLVELIYAHHRFVVALSNYEVSADGRVVTISEEDAAYVCDQRAQRAIQRLGNMVASRTLRDTPENRKVLGVAGQEEPSARYLDKWHAADQRPAA